MKRGRPKQGRKYEWAKLKRQFIKGRYKDLKEFSEAKNIPYTTLQAKGWRKRWIQDKKEIIQIADRRTKEILAETVAQTNARHIKDAIVLQDFGKNYLFRIETNKEGKEEIVYLTKPESPREAVMALKDGVEMERNALGLNKQEFTITIDVVNNIIHRVVNIINAEVKDADSRNRLASRLGEILLKEDIGGITANGGS